MRTLIGWAAAAALVALAAQAQAQPYGYGPDDGVSCQALGCTHRNGGGWDHDGRHHQRPRDGGWDREPCGHSCYYRPYQQQPVIYSYGYAAPVYSYYSYYSYAPAYGQVDVVGYPGYAPVYPYAYPYRYPSTLNVYGGW